MKRTSLVKKLTKGVLGIVLVLVLVFAAPIGVVQKAQGGLGGYHLMGLDSYDSWYTTDDLGYGMYLYFDGDYTGWLYTYYFDDSGTIISDKTTYFDYDVTQYDGVFCITLARSAMHRLSLTAWRYA